MQPAKTKSGILCSEIQTNWGTAVTRLTMTAPAPSETSKAGNAQHSRVPSELNRVSVSIVNSRIRFTYFECSTFTTE